MTDGDIMLVARDALDEAGIARLLGEAGENVRPLDRSAPSGLVVLVAPTLSDAVGTVLGSHPSPEPGPAAPRFIVITHHLEDVDLLLATQRGLSAVLPHRSVTPRLLRAAIAAVRSGSAILPASLQGMLLRQVSTMRTRVLAPQGITLSGLNARERDVLNLVAEGLGNREIADKLPYSERTVKDIIATAMSRHGFRSRSHAVAFAIRTGTI